MTVPYLFYEIVFILAMYRRKGFDISFILLRLKILKINLPINDLPIR